MQVLSQLWRDIKLLKGKVLAAYLKAVGHIIPLMDNEPARFFTEELMLVLIREFQTPDEEMKKIVLKVSISRSQVFRLAFLLSLKTSRVRCQKSPWRCLSERTGAMHSSCTDHEGNAFV